MKKVFTFFLAMAIIFGISGCGKKEYIVFPFSASDVVNYELVYIGIATKKGYLQSETSDFYYFTSSDIIGVWANLSKMRLDF